MFLHEAFTFSFFLFFCPMPKAISPDAYVLIFRAYYAFIRNPIISSNWSEYIRHLLDLSIPPMEVLEKQKPTHIAVVFDHPSQTLREKNTEITKHIAMRPSGYQISISLDS